MATLREIMDQNFNDNNRNYDEIKLRRREFESETVYVRLRFYSGVYTFIYVGENGTETPVHWRSLIADDWYVINEDENNKDLEDIIENFKMRLISVVKDIDDFQYTILNEKNKRKVK